ncbi:phosphatase PAP2 family protein [Intrasporangium sp. YIM S08009]|uniref:phosphatase PAP2 family protein n=1 Tax=Intrasporangium zincisolvens TaxID=3080018 RepID=UPI002B060437|nr:phosphatase PAP2 family protein [Intrasporangium sp. YIM S08009]
MSAVAGEGPRVGAGRPGRGGGFAVWLAIACCLLFVVVTVLVLTRATQAVDESVFHRLRPGDAWNEPQVRWSPWMTRLRPERMYLVLGATSLVVSLWRRSWWPAVLALVLAVVSGALALGTKAALHRPDPHGFVTDTGGAFPSGHTIALVVCLGGCLLVVSPRVRWWMWIPVVVAGALLTTSLLVSGAHWATDVLGGALVGVALLAVGSRTALRRRAHHPHPVTGRDARRGVGAVNDL